MYKPELTVEQYHRRNHGVITRARNRLFNLELRMISASANDRARIIRIANLMAESMVVVRAREKLAVTLTNDQEYVPYFNMFSDETMLIYKRCKRIAGGGKMKSETMNE